MGNDQGGGVDVTGTLEIVGSSTDMENLVTISATSKKRHFYVDGANDKLVLRYVKLVGGDVSSYSDYPDSNGGSILILDGEVKLYSCLLSNNKAENGAAIYARGSSSSTAKVYAENSILQGNSASIYGGGMFMRDASVALTSTTFASNSAYYGGGMFIDGDSSDVTLRQCSFISNTASSGHAIYIAKSPTIAVINTYFSDPNDNNNINQRF